MCLSNCVGIDVFDQQKNFDSLIIKSGVLVFNTINQNKMTKPLSGSVIRIFQTVLQKTCTRRFELYIKKNLIKTAYYTLKKQISPLYAIEEASLRSLLVNVKTLVMMMMMNDKISRAKHFYYSNTSQLDVIITPLYRRTYKIRSKAFVNTTLLSLHCTTCSTFHSG